MSAIFGLASTIQKSLIKPTSSFANQDSNEITTGDSFIFFLILILLLYLTMLIGAFVFNTSVVKIFPSVKKVSVLDFFGLYIVLHLLFC